MMLSLPTSVRIWMATTPTDLRKSFDTLAEVVRQQFQLDPLSGRASVVVLELPTADRARQRRVDPLADPRQRRVIHIAHDHRNS